MAVPRLRKNTGRGSLRILPAIAGCLVALVVLMNEPYWPMTENYFLFDSVKSETDGFAQLEQQAKAKQDEFCKRLLEGKIEVPILGRRGETIHVVSKEKRFNARNERESFVTETYIGGHDIVSNAIRNGGWDMRKIERITQALKGYASQHNLTMSELTFVDIGANVGFFTLNMAALGVNVYSFEPMQENRYLIRKSLCHPENKNIRERVHLFDVGLSNVTQTCFMISHNINVLDGHTICVKDPTTYVPPADYEVRGLINVDRIDNYLSSRGKHIAAVKMDTEGYEAHVVQGGPKFFFESKIPLM